MKRLSRAGWAQVAVFAVTRLLDEASATPTINSAVIHSNVLITCPGSSLYSTNNYPNSVIFEEFCGGANGSSDVHVWRLSADGTTPAVFNNGDPFRFCADVRTSGYGVGVVGLQISPWWSQDLQGRLLVDPSNGYVVAFGGRLPYFAFTRPEDANLHYAHGTLIHLEMVYLPNGLSQTKPATIEYRVTYNDASYTSGPLAFDEGNPADDPPYGRWGILNDARVGGYFELYVN